MQIPAHRKIDEYEFAVPEIGIDFAFMKEGQRGDLDNRCHERQRYQDDIQ